MQKIIAKYGAAAHLSLLAVAPLFLFPFFGGGAVAVVLLWLSFFAVVWCVMEPSLRRGEALHVARVRMARSALRDPLLWTLFVIVLLTGARALNTGIGMSYDAENAKWLVSSPSTEFFPGCVGTAGQLPFATAVALLVLLMGCRHTLGRSARMGFLLASSGLAGIAAVVAVLLTGFGNEVVTKALAPSGSDASYVGTVFAIHLLAGTVALVASYERKWRWMMPFCICGLGGTAAGLFSFSPPFEIAVFAVAEILLIAYSFFYSLKELPASCEFKFLVMVGIAFTLGGLLSVAVLPTSAVDARVAAFANQTAFPSGFAEVRDALSGIAVKSWFSHLWIGTGLGSFPLDFRFAANADAWRLVRGEVVSVPNGWLMLLAERGVIGVLTLALPLGFLLVTYFRRALGSLSSFSRPHPACLLVPVILAVVAVTGTYDCSFLRPDVLMSAGTLAALSASSFKRSKG